MSTQTGGGELLSKKQTGMDRGGRGVENWKKGEILCGWLFVQTFAYLSKVCSIFIMENESQHFHYKYNESAGYHFYKHNLFFLKAFLAY